MGTHFSSTSTDDVSDPANLPQMNVRSQLHRIITYWIRKCDKSLIEKIGMDIMNLTIETFLYQQIFESENQYKLLHFEQHQSKIDSIASKPSAKDASSSIKNVNQPSLYDYLFKLLLIGDSGVGKTSLITRYADGSYMRYHGCVAMPDFRFKTIVVDNKTIKLQIWDTAGQERWRNYLTPSYYRGAHGILLVYDIGNSKTFENIKHWNGDIDNKASGNVSKLLIGNKCDLMEVYRQDGDVVSVEDAETLAKTLCIGDSLQTSAKNGVNVDVAFECIARMVMDRIMNKDHRLIKPFYG